MLRRRDDRGWQMLQEVVSRSASIQATRREGWWRSGALMQQHRSVAPAAAREAAGGREDDVD
eukprot:10222977-Alexandrium_andersonii.AAC.1